MSKKIYIATHGEMSKGIKSALKLIVGNAADSITTYSLTPGKNANDFIKLLEEAILSEPENQFIVLGDLYGASIVNSMVGLAKYKNAVLLSGVNLSMALQILLFGNDELTEHDIEEIISESQSGIKRIELQNNIHEVNNDF